MHLHVPEADVQRAALESIAVGQIQIGPISVDELVVQDLNVHLQSGTAFVRNMTVRVRISFDLEWNVGVDLPDPFGSFSTGDTNHLGSFSFNLPPVGDVTIPGLNNINLSVPSLTARNVAVTANPLANVRLTNAAADNVEARDVILPTAGFSIAGLSLSSIQGDNIGVPAASVRQASVGRVRGDPLRLAELSLNSATIGSASVPSVRSTSAFEVPAQLQDRRIPFDLGVLWGGLIVKPTATSRIPYLEINNANATASTGRVVVRNVSLPFEALNLTLGQIGITTLDVPAFTAS